jgi:conjugal transfer pilus assembly protein TraA
MKTSKNSFLARVAPALKKMAAPSVGALLAVSAMSASAATTGGGNTGAEFQGLYNMINAWLTGYFGKAIALGAFLLGCITGIMGKPIMALVGIAFAIVLTVGPGIIDGMFAALI